MSLCYRTDRTSRSGMEQRSTERSDALSRFVERDSCSYLKDLRNIDSLLSMVPINYIAKV